MNQISLPHIVSDDLFKTVLFKPAVECDGLCIISGFATAAMAQKHIDTVKDSLGKRIGVQLIVGMTPYAGIGISHHNIFKKLTDDSEIPFNCSYMQMRCPPVHSKLYIWLKDNKPIISYSGSANYTQNAFFSGQKELMSLVEPDRAYGYFNNLIPHTIICNHIEAEEYCKKDEFIRDDNNSIRTETNSLESCELPLVSTRTNKTTEIGEIQKAAGLNWGQSLALKTPNNPRNPNDAYLAVPIAIRKKNFFPPRGRYFSVRTDDGYAINCVIAQDKGKAIHTPNDNSELGTYFRARLGVESGKRIETSDLDKYGRRDVTFIKLDEEDYYMDFSS